VAQTRHCECQASAGEEVNGSTRHGQDCLLAQRGQIGIASNVSI
jgi:hypothetical protein